MTAELMNKLVHELTRPHQTWIERENGDRETATVLPLIAQLRIEKTAGSRSGAGGDKTKRAPVAIQATMIYADIEDTAHSWYIRLPYANRGASVEDKVRGWAASTLKDATGFETETCLIDCTRWVGQIKALLNPVRRFDVVGPCPDCGEAYSWSVVDGEQVRNAAVTAGPGEALCGVCGASWVGPELHDLAAIMQFSVGRRYWSKQGYEVEVTEFVQREYWQDSVRRVALVDQGKVSNVVHNYCSTDELTHLRTDTSEVACDTPQVVS